MKIIVVHNAYVQKGGEDAVVESEVTLLRARGHEVMVYFRHNADIEDSNKISVGLRALWSGRTRHELVQIRKSFQPDVVHVHNTFPLISPSVYWVFADLPIVQTLHNYRLLCPQAMFLRREKVCEDCLGKMPWRAVVHACYRDSVAQSAVAVAMVGIHRFLGTYEKRISRFIALTQFSREKFCEGGIRREKIVVKPNFIEGGPRTAGEQRSGALYVGRLSHEKGTTTLLSALTQVPQARLKVVGEGPDFPRFVAESHECVGRLSASEVRQSMERAAFLVVPSLWYEGFPRTVVEAYAAGLPVIASRIGSLAELVIDRKTGLLVEPGSASDLAEKIQWALSHSDEMREMGIQARRIYEERYTPEQNYKELIAIYDSAMS